MLKDYFPLILNYIIIILGYKYIFII